MLIFLAKNEEVTFSIVGGYGSCVDRLVDDDTGGLDSSDRASRREDL
jgi:hypothetical protein